MTSRSKEEAREKEIKKELDKAKKTEFEKEDITMEQTVNQETEEMTEATKKEENNVDMPQEQDEVSILKEIADKKEAEAKDYLDKLQRTMAEFDNFRKRTSKEKSQMYENGAMEVAEKLLAVIDNFERALLTIKDQEKDTFVQGIEMIYKQLVTTLTDLGVVEIQAENQEFDPNFHHAVSHEENEEFGENQVIEVLQKGYMYKERVLRFAMVRVAN